MTGALEAAGVSQAEELVYRALLRVTSSSAEELSREFGISADELETILASLEAKGLASRTSARPHAVLATRPDVALEALVRRREEELQRTRVAIETLSRDYQSTPRERTADELVEVAVGRSAIAARFEQLQRAATEEVLLFSTPPYVVAPIENQTELELLEQGIAYRVIYDRSALEEPSAVEQIRRFVVAGEEARAVSGLPMKLAVADRSYAIVPVSADRPTIEAGHVLVHPSALLDALVALFEALWAQSTPLRVDPQGELAEAEHRLSADDTALLSLLLTGLTDQAIALQLGLSLRTVQRRLQHLMEATGAATRVQLGWLASQQGWLRAPPPAKTG